MKKILVPLDGSVLADRILEKVRPFLLREDAEVRLLRVLPELGYDPGHEARLAVDAAQSHLKACREGLSSQGVTVTTAALVHGDPAAKILDYAGKYRPSMIAMSTHGRTGFKRWTRGSVAERVLRHSPFPVLLWNSFHPRRTSTGPAIRTLLLPLDGSRHSAGILPLVREVALAFRARVVLLHVTELYPAMGDVPMLQLPPTRAEILRRMLPFRRLLKGVGVKIRTEMGAPAEAILEVARKEQADLIAMNTHGRSGLGRWAFGSVAEQVLRHCPYPLLARRET